MPNSRAATRNILEITVISSQLVAGYKCDINFLFFFTDKMYIALVRGRLTARLQRPVKFLSEIPVHRFDGCVFIQGVTSKLAP